ncbi:MAG TPA: hypothetical protein PKE00_12430 [Planctomycetota bacterium]|nr:hypothetical protein [Planctomycetota bacterium]
MRSLPTYLVLSFVLPFASTLPSQNHQDAFTYPDGPNVPGWSQQVGAWKIEKGRLMSTGSTSLPFLTHDKTAGNKDCVVDIEVIYPVNGPVSVNSGGVCIRYPGANAGNDFIIAKFNSANNRFEYAILYKNFVNTIFDAVPPTVHGVLRTFVRGKTTWFEVDADMDGIFEYKSAVAIDSLADSPGLAGVTANNRYVQLDNWKFYEGQLTPAPKSEPKVGTTYTMEFEAPANGGSNPRDTPWLGLLSTGNDGIRLTPDVWLPLKLDTLILSSVAFGWLGTLTTKTPKGIMALPIPNDPSFAGLKLWAAAFTFGSTRPGGFGAISNPHGFVLTK